MGTPKTRKVAALAFAAFLATIASSCFSGGAVLGGPVPVGELPTELAPKPPEVAIEIASMGLCGFVASPERPVAIHLSLANRGSSRRVRLSLEEVTTDASFGAFSSMNGGAAPLEVALGKGETRRISWTVPFLGDAAASIPPDKGGVFAVARDEAGRILGAARAPRMQAYGMPIAVLAETEGAALAIQNEILAAAPDTERPSIALMVGEAPERFWEYEAANAVVLARPFSGLSARQKSALRRFAAFGGTVVVPAEHSAFAEELTAADPGAGRIAVVGATADAEGRSRADAWRGLVAAARMKGGQVETTLPLEMRVELPSTASLLCVIGLIVLLVGPVLHISLARARRREWAWFAVPGASILLAIAMYGMASRTKGVENGAEIQHLVVSAGAAKDAIVLSQVRVQTKLAAKKTVRLVAAEGADPRHDGLQRFLYTGGVIEAPSIRMMERVVEIGPMSLHRWASGDVAFASRGDGIPLDVVREKGGGLRISNTSSMELFEVDLHTDLGWSRIAPSLARGAAIDLEKLPKPDSEATAWPTNRSNEDSAAAYARSALLSAAASFPRVGEVGELRILARCAPGGLPRVEVLPAADRVIEVSRCLWIFSPRHEEGGTL